jgi:type IV pilus assembly protein PilM
MFGWSEGPRTLKLSSKKQPPLVGLDIEAGSVAAAEVITNGDVRVGRTGVAPLAPGVTRDGEIADADALGATLKELFAQTKLPKEVRVGVANQRLVVRTLRMPQIDDPKELETAIRFQAQDHIPMPLEQSVLDYQVVAQRVGPDQRQMDVVVAAARRDMVSGLVDAVRSAGLKPVGIDVAAFGMIRALAADVGVPEDAYAASYEQRAFSEGGGGETMQVQIPAKLYCNLGDVTNLAVAQGPMCLFTRVSSFGVEGIAQRLAERRGLTLEHARQWLVHVGLSRPVEQIEGDAEIVQACRDVLAEGASKLADELRLSLDYYGTQEGALTVEEIIACGPGTMIDGLGERLERELGYGVRISRPAALAHLDEGSAARLTLSYGLALQE